MGTRPSAPMPALTAKEDLLGPSETFTITRSRRCQGRTHNRLGNSCTERHSYFLGPYLTHGSSYSRSEAKVRMSLTFLGSMDLDGPTDHWLRLYMQLTFKRRKCSFSKLRHMKYICSVSDQMSEQYVLCRAELSQLNCKTPTPMRRIIDALGVLEYVFQNNTGLLKY